MLFRSLMQAKNRMACHSLDGNIAAGGLAHIASMAAERDNHSIGSASGQIMQTNPNKRFHGKRTLSKGSDMKQKAIDDENAISDLLHGTGPLELDIPGASPFPVKRANTFGLRFLGLMGRKRVTYGLWLSPCDAIHMLFMRFPLDAVFLDRNGIITSIRIGVRPWGFAFGGKGAHSVLELPAGAKLGSLLHTGIPVPLRRNPSQK